MPDIPELKKLPIQEAISSTRAQAKLVEEAAQAWAEATENFERDPTDQNAFQRAEAYQRYVRVRGSDRTL